MLLTELRKRRLADLSIYISFDGFTMGLYFGRDWYTILKLGNC